MNHKKILSVAQKYIKMAIRYLPLNTSLHGAWIGSDGMQYIASSCFVMYIKTPVDGIPEAPSDERPRCDLEDVLSNAKSDCTVSVPMPPFESIKTEYGPVHKAMKKSAAVARYGFANPRS